MERKLDLTIAGSQLWLCSRAVADEELAWGPGNRAQGAVLLDGLVLLDPLADEEYGADIIVRTPQRFSADKRAQRTLQLPFGRLDAQRRDARSLVLLQRRPDGIVDLEPRLGRSALEPDQSEQERRQRSVEGLH